MSSGFLRFCIVAGIGFASISSGAGSLSNRLQNYGFSCQPFENGNLCTSSKNNFGSPVSVYVGKNVTTPQNILVHFHGIPMVDQRKADASAAGMIKNFNLVQQMKSAGPNSILVFPFDKHPSLAKQRELAGQFPNFMNWIKKTTGAQNEKYILSCHSGGISSVQTLLKNSKVAAKISGIIAMDPVNMDAQTYMNGEEFDAKLFAAAQRANPNLKINCYYRPHTEVAQGICTSLAEATISTSEVTQTTNHWQAVNETYAEGLADVTATQVGNTILIPTSGGVH